MAEREDVTDVHSLDSRELSPRGSGRFPVTVRSEWDFTSPQPGACRPAQGEPAVLRGCAEVQGSSVTPATGLGNTFPHLLCFGGS